MFDEYVQRRATQRGETSRAFDLATERNCGLGWRLRRHLAHRRIGRARWRRRREGDMHASRSPHCLSAALAVCVLLPAAAQAQVIPFAGNFGQGLAPSDNQMIFESVARLNAVEPSKVGQSDSWSNPETKSSGTSTILRVFQSGGMACHLVWCAIKLSQEAHRLATTASLGAARRPENGRSRADRPNVASLYHGRLSGWRRLQARAAQ